MFLSVVSPVLGAILGQHREGIKHKQRPPTCRGKGGEVALEKKIPTRTAYCLSSRLVFVNQCTTCRAQ